MGSAFENSLNHRHGRNAPGALAARLDSELGLTSQLFRVLTSPDATTLAGTARTVPFAAVCQIFRAKLRFSPPRFRLQAEKR